VASLDDASAGALPQGIDIFFDLVGGPILDAALTRAKLGGRIPSAGMVSQYNLPHHHSVLPQLVGGASGPRNAEELEPPLSDGSMRFKTHLASGLENLPATFHGVFTGQSFGKTVVRV